MQAQPATGHIWLALLALILRILAAPQMRAP